MTQDTVVRLIQPGAFSDPLTEVLREGARALLAQAVEAEVAAFLASHADKHTENGRQRLVRHGHRPERKIVTGLGPVCVRAPRVRDRRGAGEGRIRFTSAILPPYARRSKSVEVLIPILYLKGLSSGDFEDALSALLGPDAGGLSASSIARLREAWSDEHARWSKRGQRCWVHKTANVLNKLPKSQQPKAKRALQEIWMAETKPEALVAFGAFVGTYGVKYDKAVACLVKDRDALLAFYDFPAEHWKHLRTTNPIESTFATIRHRTVRSKGCLSNKTALALIFKLAEAAETRWRRLDGHHHLPKVIRGVTFTDGVEVVSRQAQAVAA